MTTTEWQTWMAPPLKLRMYGCRRQVEASKAQGSRTPGNTPDANLPVCAWGTGLSDPRCAEPSGMSPPATLSPSTVHKACGTGSMDVHGQEGGLFIVWLGLLAPSASRLTRQASLHGPQNTRRVRHRAQQGLGVLRLVACLRGLCAHVDGPPQAAPAGRGPVRGMC